MSDWQPPRCEHGNIILGCPEEPCDEQTVYLIDQETRLARWQEQQSRHARAALVAAAKAEREERDGRMA